MPPQKKNCESFIAMKKQKKIIDNRLLEISILVEDYIYEDKPIKRHEAEMYAKEVVSYTDKCLGDIRSLQVIEKLRRHMKGIILEQGESVDDNIFAQPIPSTTIVPDDDLSKYTQDKEVKDYTNEGDSPNCVKEPTDIGRNKRKVAVKRNIRVNSGLDDDLTQCTQNIEFEDLTYERDSPSVNEPVKNSGNKRKAIVKRMRVDSGLDDDFTQYTKEIDFNEECSSLNSTQTSIKNVNNKRKTKKRDKRETYSLDDDMTQYTQAEINDLDSVEKPNTTAGNKRNAITKSNIRKTKVQKNNTGNYNSDLDVIDLCDDNDNNDKEYCINVESPQATPALFSECSPSILNSFDTVPKIPKSNTKEVFEKPNPNVKNTVKNVEQTKKTTVDNIGLIKEFTVTSIPEEGNIAFPKNNDIEVMKINTGNISSVNQKNKVNKPSNTYSKVNTLKKCPFYNEKVINDLSWLENIRYVREIAKEEYEKALVSDNFWDNYTLPANWNNDDFSYT